MVYHTCYRSCLVHTIYGWFSLYITDGSIYFITPGSENANGIDPAVTAGLVARNIPPLLPVSPQSRERRTGCHLQYMKPVSPGEGDSMPPSVSSWNPSSPMVASPMADGLNTTGMPPLITSGSSSQLFLSNNNTISSHLSTQTSPNVTKGITQGTTTGAGKTENSDEDETVCAVHFIPKDVIPLSLDTADTLNTAVAMAGITDKGATATGSDHQFLVPASPGPSGLKLSHSSYIPQYSPISEPGTPSHDIENDSARTEQKIYHSENIYLVAPGSNIPGKRVYVTSDFASQFGTSMPTAIARYQSVQYADVDVMPAPSASGPSAICIRPAHKQRLLPILENKNSPDLTVEAHTELSAPDIPHPSTSQPVKGAEDKISDQEQIQTVLIIHNHDPLWW